MTNPSQFVFAVKYMDHSAVREFFELVDDCWIGFTRELYIADETFAVPRFEPSLNILKKLLREADHVAKNPVHGRRLD